MNQTKVGDLTLYNEVPQLSPGGVAQAVARMIKHYAALASLGTAVRNTLQNSARHPEHLIFNQRALSIRCPLAPPPWTSWPHRGLLNF